MKLTNLQRIILVVYAIAIINICVFFAPKSFIYTEHGNTVVWPIEYSPVWKISDRFSSENSNNIDPDNFIRIDYYRMASEAFAITVIAGVLFILTMPKKEG